MRALARSRRRLFAATALLAAAPIGAQAHALLRKSVPAVGSTLRAAPPDVAIRFSEGVEAQFSSVAVRDAAGGRVDMNNPHTAPDNNTVLIVGLRKLPPGTYTVEWHAMSVDTHKTEGRYQFTVAP